MKKDTLWEIMIGTVGGLVFALGMCMCLIPEWQLFRTGIIVSVVGFLILLLMIPIYRRTHPRKQWGITLVWLIGVARARLMGFGMSKTMHGSVSTEEMVIGLACGCIDLLICVLDYPVYLYVSKKQ